MDLQQLLAAAQQMQDHLMSAQQELADTEVEGTSGGGLVSLSASQRAAHTGNSFA